MPYLFSPSFYDMKSAPKSASVSDVFEDALFMFLFMRAHDFCDVTISGKNLSVQIDGRSLMFTVDSSTVYFQKAPSQGDEFLVSVPGVGENIGMRLERRKTSTQEGIVSFSSHFEPITVKSLSRPRPAVATTKGIVTTIAKFLFYLRFSSANPFITVHRMGITLGNAILSPTRPSHSQIFASNHRWVSHVFSQFPRLMLQDSSLQFTGAGADVFIVCGSRSDYVEFQTVGWGREGVPTVNFDNPSSTPHPLDPRVSPSRVPGSIVAYKDKSRSSQVVVPIVVTGFPPVMFGSSDPQIMLSSLVESLAKGISSVVTPTRTP